MTRDDIIRMALKAELVPPPVCPQEYAEALERLARSAYAAGAADEREKSTLMNAQETLFRLLQSERDSHAITKQTLQVTREECILLHRRCEKYQLPIWKRTLMFLKRFW